MAEATDKLFIEVGEQELLVPLVTAFINFKGGTGKTTGATNYAMFLIEHGVSTVIVDTDMQRSASTWASQVDIPSVPHTETNSYLDLLERLAHEYDAIVVDGTGSDRDMTRVILMAADLTLVPNEPGVFDISSCMELLKFATSAFRLTSKQQALYCYLNAVKSPKAQMVRDVYEEWSAAFELLQTPIAHRVVLADSPGQGTGVFRMNTRDARAARQNLVDLFTEALTKYGGH